MTSDAIDPGPALGQLVMVKRFQRPLLRLIQLLAVIGILSPFHLAARWRNDELARIRITHRDMQRTGTAIVDSCVATRCKAYPVTNDTGELARAIGQPYSDHLASKDGWGWPVRILSYGNGFVVAGPGADGEYQPEVRALLSLDPHRREEIERSLLALQAQFRMAATAPGASRVPWYAMRNQDYLYVPNDFLAMNPIRQSSAVPGDIILRYIGMASLPSILAFGLATIAIAKSRPRGTTARPSAQEPHPRSRP
jgi:hypothetical protein